MASKIEWTGDTWNPTIGCTEVSAGCVNCYAAKMAYRLAHIPAMKNDYEGLTKKLPNGKIVWTGKVKELPERLTEFVNTKKPKVVFVDSMSDLLHEDVSWNFLYKTFEMMMLSPQHTYQVLTKRADRLYLLGEIYFHLKRNYPEAVIPLPNVWIGVSVEDQKAANERIPHLNIIEAAVKFLSCEPLIGPVDLHAALKDTLKYHAGGVKNCISWVIAGGESGSKNARPMHPDWVRSLRDQCKEASVPFFFKQWGSYFTHYLALDTKEPYFKMYSDYLHFTQEDWVNKGDVCVDMNGKICKIGKDFQDAAYPVAIMNPMKNKSERILDGMTYDEFPKQTTLQNLL